MINVSNDSDVSNIIIHGCGSYTFIPLIENKKNELSLLNSQLNPVSAELESLNEKKSLLTAQYNLEIEKNIFLGNKNKIINNESISISDDALALIARFSQGSLRDAINLLEQSSISINGAIETENLLPILGVDMNAQCAPFLVDLINHDLEKCLSTISDMFNDGVNFKAFRDQLLEFYPVYQFETNGVDIANGESITAGGQKLEGGTSGAIGDIVKVVGSEVYVKVKTNDTFVPGESLTFAADTFAGAVTVASTSNVTIVPFDIPDVLSPPSYVTARNPGVPADTYDNKISGRVLLWNEQSRVLTVTNDKQPINLSLIHI